MPDRSATQASAGHKGIARRERRAQRRRAIGEEVVTSLVGDAMSLIYRAIKAVGRTLGKVLDGAFDDLS